jgi:hypothetical protein
MDAKLTSTARFDEVDAQRFKTMMESDSFARFGARIVAELERAQFACERAEEVIQLRRAQGVATALRMVLELPKTMLAEMKKGPA